MTGTWRCGIGWRWQEAPIGVAGYRLSCMDFLVMALELILTEKAIIATVLAVEDTARISRRFSTVFGLIMSKDASHVFEFTVAMVLRTSVVLFINPE